MANTDSYQRWTGNRPRYKLNIGNYAARNLKKYNLTRDDYEWLFWNQDGKCAICDKEQMARLVVDHDHTNGRIRGLLCYRCNSFIGPVFDDPELLAKISKYAVARKGTKQ